MSDAQPQQPPPAQPGTFQIEKIYVKDMSLEIPHSPKIFLEQVQPQLEVQINTGAENFAEGHYEVLPITEYAHGQSKGGWRRRLSST